MSFDVLVDFYSFLFNFIPINIHTYNLLSLTAMMTSTAINMGDIQTSHLSQTQKCHVETAILYHRGCLLPNPIYRPFIHKSKQQGKLSCVLKPKYVMQKPVKQGMTVLNCEQLQRDKIPTYTPKSIVTIYMKAMRQELVSA